MAETAPREDVRDLLALHLTPGLGSHRIAALLEHFGSAAAVLRATPAALEEVPGIGRKLATALDGDAAAREADQELNRAGRAGVAVVGRGLPGYPSWLAAVPGAPAVLFLRGSVQPTDGRAVALVGTRGADAYGRRMAQRLADGLARAGVVVVSGLARGIDGVGHQAALDAGGRTLAVMAGGLARVYPPEHRNLAEQVVAHGALISEGRMEQSPDRGLFPARNRIISALSRVVVIVQADTGSGALITAEHASEQGVTVMAVPGPIDGGLHDGCHRLLREGAILCRGVEDVLEELDGVSATATRQKSEARSRPPREVSQAAPVPAPAPVVELDEPQRRVWDLLADGPRVGDEIAQRLAMGVAQLSNVLIGLELRRMVRRLPGNRYERT